MLVEGDNQENLIPVRARTNCLINIGQKLLSSADVVRRMVIVRVIDLEFEWRELGDEAGFDK
jgi:hypothetical protein